MCRPCQIASDTIGIPKDSAHPSRDAEHVGARGRPPELSASSRRGFVPNRLRTGQRRRHCQRRSCGVARRPLLRCGRAPAELAGAHLITEFMPLGDLVQASPRRSVRRTLDECRAVPASPVWRPRHHQAHDVRTRIDDTNIGWTGISSGRAGALAGGKRVDPPSQTTGTVSGSHGSGARTSARVGLTMA